MNAIDLLVRQLNISADMLKNTLADFSDEELAHRPANGANHPLWQLGHLCNAEVFFVTQLGGAMPELPAGFSDRFNKNSCCIDDAKHFAASKQQLMDLFLKLRAATIAYVKTLKPEDLEKPSSEKLKQMAPTVGDALSIQAMHPVMHLGQIQVVRRKLGKAILF